MKHALNIYVVTLSKYLFVMLNQLNSKIFFKNILILAHLNSVTDHVKFDILLQMFNYKIDASLKNIRYYDS